MYHAACKIEFQPFKQVVLRPMPMETRCSQTYDNGNAMFQSYLSKIFEKKKRLKIRSYRRYGEHGGKKNVRFSRVVFSCCCTCTRRNIKLDCEVTADAWRTCDTTTKKSAGVSTTDEKKRCDTMKKWHWDVRTHARRVCMPLCTARRGVRQSLATTRYPCASLLEVELTLSYLVLLKDWRVCASYQYLIMQSFFSFGQHVIYQTK